LPNFAPDKKIMAILTEEELLFRKVEAKVQKAIWEYDLIADGDRIVIGLSGGKDSLALVDLDEE